MSGGDIGAIIVLGPLVLLWWACTLRVIYNIIRHGNFDGS